MRMFGAQWRQVRAFAKQSIPSQVPVMIVGGGPVGMTLSILLSRLGVRSLLVEKRREFSRHPQAHLINNRTMEIFRRINGLGAEIQALQPPHEQWRKFVYCTALDGPILGEVDQIHPEDLTNPRSPTSIAHFSQNRLLPLLLNHARSSGVSVNGEHKLPGPVTGNILMGAECVSIRPSPDAVSVEVHCSPDLRQRVECQYLVAADGAGSGVRKSMGVKLSGEHNMQQLINVHFSSERLARYLAANRPAMLYFVFSPAAIAIIVAHDLRLGEFVAQLPFYPPQQTAEEFTNEACKRIISGLVSKPSIDIEIQTVKPWVMHAEVADTYVCGDGRIFLAGDAAHRFPPAGAFGMNTGIQDVHNLAWKLDAVLKGVAQPSLLRSYEQERRPVAVANTALSVSNVQAAMSIPSALGLDPSYARKVHEAVNSSVGAMLPKGLQSALLDTAFSIGRAQVSSFFLNRHNPVAGARLAEVEKIIQQKRSLQLQFPSEDLFFRYKHGALVQDDQQENAALGAAGVRLPHMKIRVIKEGPGSSNNKDDLCSTLDLVDERKLEFVLIVGHCSSGMAWAADAVEAARTCGMPLKVVVMSSDDCSSLDAAANYTVVVPSESWWEVCGLPQSGALLVRPDDHIAWRSVREHGTSSLLQLEKVFGTLLGSRDVVSHASAL